MQDHTEQHLDKLAKKVMQTSSLESPTKDFTANIMSQIEGVSIAASTSYKPLISKLGWAAIVLILMGISSFVMFSNLESTSLLDKIDFSFISNNKVTNAVSGITFSKIIMYIVVLFGGLWFVQIQLVKRQLEKSLNY